MPDSELYKRAFLYPSQKDSKNIRDSFPSIKEMYLHGESIKVKEEHHTHPFDALFVHNDINNWLTIINNTLGKLKFSYILSKFYYNEGIADDKWKVNLDTGGTKFFPYLEDDGDRYILFLFNYSIENFYFRYVTSLDRLAQLLNIYFNLGLTEKQVALNDKLSKKLKDVDSPLSKVIDEFITKSKLTYNNRNSLAHRFPFNEIDIRSQKQIDEKGRKVTTLGLAKYTKSKEVINDIESSVELLSKVLRAVELALT